MKNLIKSVMLLAVCFFMGCANSNVPTTTKVKHISGELDSPRDKYIARLLQANIMNQSWVAIFKTRDYVVHNAKRFITFFCSYNGKYFIPRVDAVKNGDYLFRNGILVTYENSTNFDLFQNLSVGRRRQEIALLTNKVGGRRSIDLIYYSYMPCMTPYYPVDLFMFKTQGGREKKRAKEVVAKIHALNKMGKSKINFALLMMEKKRATLVLKTKDYPTYDRSGDYGFGDGRKLLGKRLAEVGYVFKGRYFFVEKRSFIFKKFSHLSPENRIKAVNGKVELVLDRFRWDGKRYLRRK